MPAASSPPGSHLPKKKSKKRKYNPPNVGGAIKNAGSSATKAGGGKPSKKEREAAAKAAAAVVKANVAVAKAVSTTKPSKMKKGYYTRQLSGKKASGDSLSTEDKEQLRKVRELNKEYEESSIVKKVLLAPPGVAAGDAPFIGKIGSPSNVTNAIKGIFKTGEKRAATKASGTAKGLDEGATVTRTPAPKRGAPPKQGGAVPAKGEEAAAKLRKAISKKANKEPWSSKAARQAKLRRTANKLKWAGASAPIAGAVGGGIAYNTGKALVEDPGETLKTTAQTIPGFVTAPVGDVKALAKGDWEYIAKEWEDYYKMAGEASQPGGEEIIKTKTGLVLPASIALMAYGGARGAYGKRPHTTADISVRDARLIDKAANGDAKAQAKLATGRRTPFANKRGRGTTAREAQAFKDMGEGAAAADLREGGLGRHARSPRKIAKVETGKNPNTGKPIRKTVRVGDAVPTLGRFTVALDKVKGLQQVRDLIASMESKRGPDDVTNPAKLSDLDILRAIEQNPAILETKSLRKALEARSRSAPEVSKSRALLAGEDGSQPLRADERAQYLPMARALDVNTPEERIPRAIENLTSVKPKAHQEAAAAIRAEARALLRQANDIEKKGKALGDEAMIDGANMLREQGKTLLGEVNRLRRADAMNKLANRIESGGSVPKKYRDLDPDELNAAAQQLREDAAQLVREQYDLDAEQQRGYVGDVQTAMKEGGYRDDPFYVKTGDARELPSEAGNEGKVHIDQTPREKMSEGILAEKGLQEAGAAPFLRGIVEQRIHQAQTAYGRSFLENPDITRHGADGKPLIVTSDEYAKMVQTGEIPAGFTKMSLQEMAKHYQKGTFEEFMGNITSPGHQAIREARGLEGNKYFVVQKGAKREFEAQAKELGAGWKALRIIGAAQSIGLLATSPAWFLYQLAASPLVMFARHPNILRYPAAAKRVVARYHQMDKRGRDVFNGMIGGGSANIFENLRDAPLSSDARIVGRMADAQALARSTWGGRIVTGFTENLKRGGPLMTINRRYEAFIRQFDAMLEVDKLIRQERHPEVHRFGKSVSHLDDYTGQLIAQLKGKSQAEIEQFFTQNGTARRELARRVDDALGNWNALSANERRAATMFIFYPFLRFSLRWTFYAFPKNNPMKAAIGANIAAINAIELEEQNGGEELNFFSDYGKVHVPGSNEVLNLGRIAPGSNAYIEAGMGRTTDPIQMALSGTQPIFNLIYSAAENKDPFTGEPLEGEDRLTSLGDRLSAVGEGVASLNPMVRPQVDPSSPYSELLRTIRGQPTDDYAYQAKPQISTDANREMEAQRVGRLMDTAFSDLTDDNGDKVEWAELATMPASKEKLKLIRKYNEQVAAKRELIQQFEKYGIESPLEPSKFMAFPVANSTKRDENQETRQPPRSVYIDPEKKEQWYDAGKQYGGSSDDGESSSVMDQYRNTGTDIMDKYRGGTSSVMDKYR